MEESGINYLEIINWENYQHYKDRNPPWIKLHTNLMTSKSWVMSDNNQKILLITVMLLAARYDNKIPNNPDYIMRVGYLDNMPDMNWLIEIGFCREYDEGSTKKNDWGSRYISNELRSHVFSRDKNRCVFCGSEKSLEIDHIIPVSKGGNSNEKNLQVLCRTCNRKKRTRIANATQSVAEATQRGHSSYSETEKRRGRGEETFAQFWDAYPKKRNKGDAEKAWKALCPSEDLALSIIEAVQKQKTSKDWRKEGGKFIPYPASWLRAKGWEDVVEVEIENRGVQRHGAWVTKQREDNTLYQENMLTHEIREFRK